jgi:hypothetical protein
MERRISGIGCSGKEFVGRSTVADNIPQFFYGAYGGNGEMQGSGHVRDALTRYAHERRGQY